MFDRLDSPEPPVVSASTRAGVDRVAARLRFQRRVQLLAAASTVALLAGGLAVVGGGADKPTEVTTVATPDAAETTTTTMAPPSTTTTAAAAPSAGAPTTTTTAAPRVRPTTSTTSPVTTTTTPPRWRQVADCNTAESERPGYLYIYFSQMNGQPRWSFAEARDALQRAGASTQHLDRIGAQRWSSHYYGYTGARGTVGELKAVRDRLASSAGPPGADPPTGYLYCADQEAKNFDPDSFVVRLLPGVSIDELVARHGGRETVTRQYEAGEVSWSRFVTLETSEPDRLFWRFITWWSDNDVAWAEFNGIATAYS